MHLIKLLNKQGYLSILLVFLSFNFTINSFSQSIFYGEKRIAFNKDQHILSNTILKDTFYTRFTPTLVEVNIADSITKAIFPKSYNGREVQALDVYYRQYYGIIRQGQKFLLIKGYCSKPEGFAENTSGVIGGGNCFYSMLINLSGHKVDRYYFNAPR